MNLYKKAGELFGRYPQAVRPVTRDGSVRSMTLMCAGHGGEQFFTLTLQGDRHDPSCSLFRWREDGIVTVTPDGAVTEQDGALSMAEAESAVTTAVPLPRDGSLWGWAPQRTVTALIAIYGEDGDDHPTPTWTPMLLAGTSPADWPGFTGERLLGTWFWDACRAGRLVEIGPHVANSRQAVWWADTKASLGDDCCAVARPLSLPGGITLPRGLFVYDGTLRAGTTLPSLDGVLAMHGKTDLGPRFREAA